MTISEREFFERLCEALADVGADQVGAVTGPGRSGAIAAAYASYILGIPFLAFGARHFPERGRLLIVDTTRKSAKLVRKAELRYRDHDILTVFAFETPPGQPFWYEERDRPLAGRGQ